MRLLAAISKVSITVYHWSRAPVWGAALLLALLIPAIPAVWAGDAAPLRYNPSVPGEIIGEQRRHMIQRSESLLEIARRFHTDPGSLARLNQLKSWNVKPGQVLNLPTFHILPARIPEGIVLNIPERALYLFKRGQFLGRFPVAVGMKGWPTPVGSYDIHMMLEDPVWVTPDEMVRRKRVASAVIPGSKSPLGDRWMGWCEVGPDQSEVGFHGTNDVTSIGKLASHACVRLYPEHAREVYSQAYEGMPVVSLYEPIKVGKQNDSYYLSVSPDIYNRKKVSLARALQLLKKAGAKKPDTKRVKTLLARQDGYPYLVATK